MYRKIVSLTIKDHEASGSSLDLNENESPMFQYLSRDPGWMEESQQSDGVWLQQVSQYFKALDAQAERKDAQQIDDSEEYRDFCFKYYTDKLRNIHSNDQLFMLINRLIENCRDSCHQHQQMLIAFTELVRSFLNQERFCSLNEYGHFLTDLCMALKKSGAWGTQVLAQVERKRACVEDFKKQLQTAESKKVAQETFDSSCQRVIPLSGDHYDGNGVLLKSSVAALYEDRFSDRQTDLDYLGSRLCEYSDLDSERLFDFDLPEGVTQQVLCYKSAGNIRRFYIVLSYKEAEKIRRGILAIPAFVVAAQAHSQESHAKKISDHLKGISLTQVLADFNDVKAVLDQFERRPNVEERVPVAATDLRSREARRDQRFVLDEIGASEDSAYILIQELVRRLASPLPHFGNGKTLLVALFSAEDMGGHSGCIAALKALFDEQGAFRKKLDKKELQKYSQDTVSKGITYQSNISSALTRFIRETQEKVRQMQALQLRHQQIRVLFEDLLFLLDRLEIDDKPLINVNQSCRERVLNHHLLSELRRNPEWMQGLGDKILAVIMRKRQILERCERDDHLIFAIPEIVGVLESQFRAAIQEEVRRRVSLIVHEQCRHLECLLLSPNLDIEVRATEIVVKPLSTIASIPEADQQLMSQFQSTMAKIKDLVQYFGLQDTGELFSPLRWRATIYCKLRSQLHAGHHPDPHTLSQIQHLTSQVCLKVWVSSKKKPQLQVQISPGYLDPKWSGSDRNANLSAWFKFFEYACAHLDEQQISALFKDKVGFFSPHIDIMYQKYGSLTPTTAFGKWLCQSGGDYQSLLSACIINDEPWNSDMLKCASLDDMEPLLELEHRLEQSKKLKFYILLLSRLCLDFELLNENQRFLFSNLCRRLDIALSSVSIDLIPDIVMQFSRLILSMADALAIDRVIPKECTRLITCIVQAFNESPDGNGVLFIHRCFSSQEYREGLPLNHLKLESVGAVQADNPRMKVHVFETVINVMGGMMPPDIDLFIPNDGDEWTRSKCSFIAYCLDHHSCGFFFERDMAHMLEIRNRLYADILSDDFTRFSSGLYVLSQLLMQGWSLRHLFFTLIRQDLLSISKISTSVVSKLRDWCVETDGNLEISTLLMFIVLLDDFGLVGRRVVLTTDDAFDAYRYRSMIFKHFHLFKAACRDPFRSVQFFPYFAGKLLQGTDSITFKNDFPSCSSVLDDARTYLDFKDPLFDIEEAYRAVLGLIMNLADERRVPAFFTTRYSYEKLLRMSCVETDFTAVSRLLKLVRSSSVPYFQSIKSANEQPIHQKVLTYCDSACAVIKAGEALSDEHVFNLIVGCDIAISENWNFSYCPNIMALPLILTERRHDALRVTETIHLIHRILTSEDALQYYINQGNLSDILKKTLRLPIIKSLSNEKPSETILRHSMIAVRAILDICTVLYQHGAEKAELIQRINSLAAQFLVDNLSFLMQLFVMHLNKSDEIAVSQNLYALAFQILDKTLLLSNFLTAEQLAEIQSNQENQSTVQQCLDAIATHAEREFQAPDAMRDVFLTLSQLTVGISE